jgi:hypothetical protein
MKLAVDAFGLSGYRVMQAFCKSHLCEILCSADKLFECHIRLEAAAKVTFSKVLASACRCTVNKSHPRVIIDCTEV